MNWLREKHRLARWEEEVKLVDTDFDCAIAWYSHQIRKWEGYAEKAKENGSHGTVAYAYKQAHVWGQLQLRIKEVKGKLDLIN